jgi:hypothetical protein
VLLRVLPQQQKVAPRPLSESRLYAGKTSNRFRKRISMRLSMDSGMLSCLTPTCLEQLSMSISNFAARGRLKDNRKDL